MTQIGAAMVRAGKGRPKFAEILLVQGEATLRQITERGLAVPIAGGDRGERLQVRFRQISKPFGAREGTGWMAVRVKSQFGAPSTLLFEPKGGYVSGLIRLCNREKEPMQREQNA